MERELAQQLSTLVERAARELARIDDAAAGTAPAPGKWSPKQVLGHLIDSATINHQRFAQAATSEVLVFAPYDQDQFEALQATNEVPWLELLELWRLLNRHVARVMELTSSDALLRPRPEHNLDRIAWRPIAVDEPATLEQFMRDYTAHLAHHLEQIDPGPDSP